METIQNGSLDILVVLTIVRMTKKKTELFKKIEPSLTFLDFPSLERKGADFGSKIDVLRKGKPCIKTTRLSQY